jgi:hypothetical protein
MRMLPRREAFSKESRRHRRGFGERVGHEFERVAHRGAIGRATETNAHRLWRGACCHKGIAGDDADAGGAHVTDKGRTGPGGGSDAHKWNRIGSVRRPLAGRIAAASRCRSIDSWRTALSK